MPLMSAYNLLRTYHISKNVNATLMGILNNIHISLNIKLSFEISEIFIF